jgi:hypothetical protein
VSITTFFFDFKANYDSAVKGMEQTKKKANETGGAIGKVEDKLKSSARNIGAYIGSFMAVGYVGNQILQTADAMNSLAESSNSVGMAVGELDAWSQAIEDAGGSGESFRGSLKGLAKDLAIFSVKGKSKNTDFFTELGLNQKNFKTVGDMLPALADSLSKLSDTEALGMGEKLGLDERTVAVLKQGREATMKMIEAQKKLGVMTDEDAKKIAEYDDAMDLLGKNIKNIWRSMTLAIVPAMKWLAEGFSSLAEVWRENGDAIKTGLLIFVGIMTAVFLPQLLALVSGLLATGAAWLVAFWPIVLIVALVAMLSAALAIFWEDFNRWIEGGSSQLGTWLGSWQDMKANILGILADLQAAWDRFTGGITEKWEGLKKKFDAAKNFIGLGGDAELIASAQTTFNAASGTPLNAAPVNGALTSNQSSTVQVGSVTVNTQATDAAGVAGALGSELSTQLKQANAGFDDGVAA